MIILPGDSPLYQKFHALVNDKRFIFVAGIPGVGKSLYVQQLALLAQAAGRKVHLFQYDVTRMAFEGSRIGLEKYPEIDGFTQPAMRKAVGLWAREGVAAWDQNFSDQSHILIGEVPLIGNRLIELVQRHDDEPEALLSGDQAYFVVPVPSVRIRNRIEASRKATIANPRNAKEVKDAQPQVIRQNWEEAYRLGVILGKATPVPAGDEQAPTYDPAVYARCF